MNVLHTIILGIVEGVTEFLPISSTAHLEITQQLLHITQSDFVKSFNIIIQLGAIFAVVILYLKKILSSYKYFINICIAFIPTGIIGFILYKIIKSFLLGNVYIASAMLILGGIVIILYERKQSNKLEVVSTKTIESLSIKELLILGCVQALAVVPGVSRSGAVIIGGRVLGLSNVVITEFSFLLAIPTMLAAVAYDILKSGLSFSKGEWGIITLGFIVSFVVAILLVKWLIKYIKTHSFEVFGWYRVIIGAIILIFFIR